MRPYLLRGGAFIKEDRKVGNGKKNANGERVARGTRGGGGGGSEPPALLIGLIPLAAVPYCLRSTPKLLLIS